MRVMLTRIRRGFARCGAAQASLFVVLLALAPAVQAEQGADGYLKDYGQRALAQLSEPGISEEEREARFDKLLAEGFDVAAIGQFVVARYWRAADDKQRADFLAVFRDYLAQRFLPLFRDYKGEKFDTQAPKPTDREGVVWVPLRLQANEGEPIKTEWLLRETDGGDYKILDIKAEGTSMAITLRDEYASVIRREGGLDGLTSEIRRLLDQGAFIPKKS